jgi:hypothetical protein
MYTIKSRVVTWFKIRVFQQHNHMEHLQETYSNQDKVAIIALWPRPAVLPSVLRLISILSNENVHPVCILNKSKHLASWLPKLKETNATIIIRPNVGRDFGAYRAGYRYLKKRRILEEVTNLVFVNDSTYFLDNSKEAIRSTISSTVDVSALYMNYQFHIHAQSFFLNFSRNTFNSKKFAKFWDSYYPSQERKHAIEKGEIKLSRILQKSGYLFDVYYSASRIGQTIQEHPLKIAELALALKALDDPQTLRRREYLPEYFVSYLSARVAESENVSHHFGLFLTRVLGAPIKLDILKSGVASSFDVKTALESHVSPDEIHSLLVYMQSQGTWASNRGLKAIWVKRGLIS